MDLIRKLGIRNATLKELARKINFGGKLSYEEGKKVVEDAEKRGYAIIPDGNKRSNLVLMPGELVLNVPKNKALLDSTSGNLAINDACCYYGFYVGFKSEIFKNHNNP